MSTGKDPAARSVDNGPCLMIWSPALTNIHPAWLASFSLETDYLGELGDKSRASHTSDCFCKISAWANTSMPSVSQSECQGDALPGPVGAGLHSLGK